MTEIYFDIETLYWSDEVDGGWKNIPGFGMAVAVSCDTDRGYTVFEGREGAKELLADLVRFDKIITFNGERFDFKVLSAYGNISALYEKSFDLLSSVTKNFGHRVSLDSLAKATLGRGKNGDGKEAVYGWRSEKPEERRKVIQYCRNDVDLLRDLVEYGRKYHCLMVHKLGSKGRRVRISYKE